jgi:hypothetical protein
LVAVVRVLRRFGNVVNLSLVGEPRRLFLLSAEHHRPAIGN